MASLSGRVLDGRGVAVANARVLCWALEGEQAVPIKEIRTDARGAFGLEGLRRGRHKLLVEAPGFETSSFTALAPAGSLVLPLGGESREISGVVLRTDGSPAVGARIVLLAGDDRAPREAAADDDGEFTFTDVDPGLYRLRAVFGRNASEILPGIVLGDAENPPRMELRLKPAVWLSGTVVDAERQPVRGAEVLLDSEVETGVPEVLHTDNLGVWDAGAVALGRYRLTARLPGHVMKSPAVITVDGAHSRSQREALVMTNSVHHPAGARHGVPHRAQRALQAKNGRSGATR